MQGLDIEGDEGVQGEEEEGGGRWKVVILYRRQIGNVVRCFVVQRRSECASYFYMVHSERHSDQNAPCKNN